MQQLPSLLLITTFLAYCYAQQTAYSTNFTSFDSNHWTLSTDCEHCSGHQGQECTQNSPSAINFNSSGAIITTTVLPEKSSCGGLCKSGHMEFKQNILYG
eukprot:165372_1